MLLVDTGPNGEKKNKVLQAPKLPAAKKMPALNSKILNFLFA